MKIKLFTFFLILNTGIILGQTYTAPRISRVDNLTYDGFSISWLPAQSSDPQSWFSYYIDLSGGTGASLYNTTGWTYNFSGLSANTTYKVNLWAKDNRYLVNTSSDVINIKTPCVPAVTSYNRDYSGSNVVLQAGTTIQIKPGFRYKAETGKILTTKFVPCTTLFSEMEGIIITDTVLLTIDPRMASMDNIPTGNVSIEVTSVLVYPNPVKSTLNVHMEDKAEQIKELHLYNLAGALMQSKAVANVTEQMDMTSYANGIYLLRIMYKDGRTESRKIVLSK